MANKISNWTNEQTEDWVIKHTFPKKYVESLKNAFPNHSVYDLVKLNSEYRILLIKYVFEIENMLQHILINNLFRTFDEKSLLSYFYNENKAKSFLSFLVKKYRRVHLFRKSDSYLRLFKIMSFEYKIRIIEILKPEYINKISYSFSYKNSESFKRDITELKNLRNFLAHSSIVLGANLFKRIPTSEYFTFENDKYKNALELSCRIIEKLSSNIIYLEEFTSQIDVLFEKYNIFNIKKSKFNY